MSKKTTIKLNQAIIKALGVAIGTVFTGEAKLNNAVDKLLYAIVKAMPDDTPKSDIAETIRESMKLAIFSACSTQFAKTKDFGLGFNLETYTDSKGNTQRKLANKLVPFYVPEKGKVTASSIVLKLPKQQAVSRLLAMGISKEDETTFAESKRAWLADPKYNTNHLPKTAPAKSATVLPTKHASMKDMAKTTKSVLDGMLEQILCSLTVVKDDGTVTWPTKAAMEQAVKAIDFAKIQRVVNS